MIFWEFSPFCSSLSLFLSLLFFVGFSPALETVPPLSLSVRSLCRVDWYRSHGPIQPCRGGQPALGRQGAPNTHRPSSSVACSQTASRDSNCRILRRRWRRRRYSARRRCPRRHHHRNHRRHVADPVDHSLMHRPGRPGTGRPSSTLRRAEATTPPPLSS